MDFKAGRNAREFEGEEFGVSRPAKDPVHISFLDTSEEIVQIQFKHPLCPNMLRGAGHDRHTGLVCVTTVVRICLRQELPQDPVLDIHENRLWC